MKILVADDSKTNLMILTDSLQRLGHEVIAVSSGLEAIAEYTKDHPDLIILDVVMEGLDGFETAKRIREQNNEEWIPIIFLSSSVDDSSIAKGINAGGDDYIAKPFSEITLQAKITAMQRIAEMRKKLFNTTQELLILSTTDALTGIANRFQFEKTLKIKLYESDQLGTPLALMFIDIDNFKMVNDTIGHHVGDLLLVEVVRRIKSCIRSGDFFARIGGDEFVIVLHNLKSIECAGDVAAKIIHEFKVPFILEGHHLRISVSIGVAQYPDDDVTHESFVQNADIAMYHAKSMGKNTFQYFTNELDEQYHRQVHLERDLKLAIEKQDFIITYQPIYQLITKKIIGVEALLFWKHPEYGFVAPGIFIPIAEESGLISKLGSWMLRKVCKQGSEWLASGFKDFKLYVDVSLHQFVQQDFSDTVVAILQESQFPAEKLELELTESNLITYTHLVKDSLKKLHDNGVGIAIDDFGVRYSSLTSLDSLPVTTLKINKAFVNNAVIDVKGGVIASSLINLGNNLNLNVVAEGIKTPEQLQFLIYHGCTMGQGDYLSEPIAESDMRKLLEIEKTSSTK